MRIDIDQLASKGFKLDLDGDGVRERLVELAPTSALSGYYESTDDATRVRAAAADTLTILTLLWPLGSTKLALSSDAQLSSVQVGLTFPKTGRAKQVGWAGGVAIGRLSAGGVEVTLPSLPRPIEIEGLQLEDAAVVRDKGTLRLEAARARIKRLTVALEGMTIIVDDVELPKGLRYDDAGLAIAELSMGELRVSLDSLSGMFGGGDEKKKTKKRATKSTPFDWRILDHLNGKLDVDLTADATVPLIGRRKATHHFRIPIDEGTIDYKAMERNLSALEDSVLDFRVRDNRLCLIVDVPLMSFDKKTLVHWNLERDELVMAKRKRVRLRRLRDYQMRERKETSGQSSDKKSSFALRALYFDTIEFEVSLRGPTELPLGAATLSLGVDKQPAVAALRLRGDVHYDTKGQSVPTELRFDLESLNARLAGMAVGKGTLGAGAIGIGSFADVTLSLDGMRPGKLAAALRTIDIRDVVLTF